jgi:hypothetical protein
MSIGTLFISGRITDGVELGNPLSIIGIGILSEWVSASYAYVVFAESSRFLLAANALTLGSLRAIAGTALMSRMQVATHRSSILATAPSGEHHPVG